jgi:hypothetical protein
VCRKYRKRFEGWNTSTLSPRWSAGCAEYRSQHRYVRCKSRRLDKNFNETIAFPAGITAGATWDKDLLHRRGVAIGEEFRGKGVNIHLGPSVGALGRKPRGGRSKLSFEFKNSECSHTAQTGKALGRTLYYKLLEAH